MPTPRTTTNVLAGSSAPSYPLSEPNFRQPQQTRSRAALHKLLTAAEEVLIGRGLDDFTIAEVAERAGVSVGTVYRRFAGKQQLLAAVLEMLALRAQDTVTEWLNNAEPSLHGVITAFTHGLAAHLAETGPALATLSSGPRTAETQQLGLQVLTILQRLFFDAAAPHGAEIRRRGQNTALITVLRTIIAASVHRTAISSFWPDGLSWNEWANEITDMTTAYLTAP